MNKLFPQTDIFCPLLLNLYPTQIRHGGAKLNTVQVPKKEEAYDEA